MEFYRRDLVESVKQAVLADLPNYELRQADPYRDIASTLVANSRQPSNSTWVPPSLPPTGEPGITARLANALNNGQFKGVLYGLGAVAVGALILPSVNLKLRKLVNRTVTDGSEIVDRAKSMLVRTKEGMEDIVAEASFNRWQKEFMDPEQTHQPEPPRP